MENGEDEIVEDVVTFVSSANYHSSKMGRRNEDRTSIFLYFAAFVVTTLSNMTFGIMVVWISPVAPKLLSDDPEINPLSQPMTTVQLSIIAGCPSIGFILGPLLFSGLFDKFGRKTMLLTFSVPAVISLIAMAHATNIYVMCVETLVIVLCLGAAYSGTTMYLSEISDNHDRAKIACIGSCGFSVGNFMCFVFSSITPSVRGFTLISAVPAVVCMVIMVLFLPESPVYLLLKGRSKDASGALKKLRIKTEAGLQKELDFIAYVLQETKSDKAPFITLFTDTANRRAFMVVLGVHILNFFCGSPAIMSYLTIIFDRAGTKISSDFASILLTSIQLLAICGASQVVGKFRRRTLLVLSTIVCTVMLFSLGVFFCLKSYQIGFIENFTWWPLMALIIFYTSFAFGVGPVSWVLASELFSSNVISAALSIIIPCDGMCSFVSIFAFPLAMEALGIQWVFWGFSIAFSLGLFFVFFRVPETRGKNLVEIRRMLVVGSGQIKNLNSV